MALNSKKHLSPAEIAYLEDLLERQSNLRDVLLILVALKTGARASELLGIRKADLNKHARTILIDGLKGSNSREIPVKKQLFDKLLAYADTVEGEMLFPISYRRLAQVWDEYKPSKKSFHSLRHTFAILLYKKSKDIRLVKHALGHKSLANTMIYADYAYTSSELRRAMV